MNTTVSQEILDTVFDEVTRETTQKVAGIQLYRGGSPPSGDLYTVYAAFQRGFHSSLSMRAEVSFFVRLAQNIMQSEQVTQRDVEDFAKEYFNVLCGQVASKLFQVTQVASRFGLPYFYHGQYQPEGYQNHFTIEYSSDRGEGIQLIHHMPVTK